jgi:lipopolysaccharide export system permease protein
MTIIERYLLRRMTVLFLAATGASLGIVWTVQALAKINLVTDTGQSIGTFLKIATMLLPTVIPIVLPFAVLIGVTQTLSTMNTDSELAVIAASGARRSVVFRPALILAVLVSLSVAFVSHVLEPYSRQVVRSMVASANSDLISLAIQEGTFKRIEKDLYIQIAERLPDGKLGGIFFADSRDPKVDLLYFAKSGFVSRNGDTSLLFLNDGEAHRRDADGSNFSIIRFTSYAFDLSSFQKTAGGVTLHPKDRSTAYLLNPDKNDRTFIMSPQRLTGALHKRFTVWAYPLVFALIALLAAGEATPHRQAQLNTTMTAASLAMAVRWAGLYFEDMADDSMTGVYGLYAVPAIAVGLCIWSIHRQETLRLRALPQKIADFAVQRLAPTLTKASAAAAWLRTYAQREQS